MESYIRKNQKKLRCGFTTGTCATAAASAAATRLLFGIVKKEVRVHTPKQVILSIPVYEEKTEINAAQFFVEKDSGDDPDVTNHTKIHVCVRKVFEKYKSNYVFYDSVYPLLSLDGGIGVGRVTREGLEQNIGYAAINKVPRSMIFQAVEEVRKMASYEGRLHITVIVPEGERLAKKTFNPKLGIEGGISILGTSGIIEPMSEKAIVDTIETQIRQLSRQGEKSLLVTPGNYGQSYAAKYCGLNLEDSVKCSNYIGETIDLAVSYGMKRFLLVGNIGKLCKLAAGIMNTHSKVADGRKEIFITHTIFSGGTRWMAEELADCITTEKMLEKLEVWGLREDVMKSICQEITKVLKHRMGEDMEFGVLLFSENFGFLGEVGDGKKLISQIREEQKR